MTNQTFSPKQIGKEVKARRLKLIGKDERTISIYALSKAAGVRPQVVKNIENGGSFTSTTLEKILAALTKLESKK